MFTDPGVDTAGTRKILDGPLKGTLSCCNEVLFVKMKRAGRLSPHEQQQGTHYFLLKFVLLKHTANRFVLKNHIWGFTNIFIFCILNELICKMWLLIKYNWLNWIEIWGRLYSALDFFRLIINLVLKMCWSSTNCSIHSMCVS